MPESLIRELEKGGKESTVQRIGSDGKLVVSTLVSNETEGLISVIALLSEEDPDVETAWLCHPSVKHVGKEVYRAGGFCGYRNIQMMLSYCQSVPVAGAERFL